MSNDPPARFQPGKLLARSRKFPGRLRYVHNVSESPGVFSSAPLFEGDVVFVIGDARAYEGRNGDGVYGSYRATILFPETGTVGEVNMYLEEWDDVPSECLDISTQNIG